MSILDEFNLDGRRAVVTGGGKGIGRDIALALAEAGADVLVSARSSEQIESVAAEIRTLGRQGAAHAADITAPGAAEALADAAHAALGGIDIWVNNAGGLPGATPHSLRRTTEASWDAQVDLNMKAVWQGCVTAANHMGEAGGAIVNISSMTAWGPQRRNGPYAASKAAVNSLTQTLSIELAPSVRVNAVAPGPVLTDNFVESVGYEGERKAAIDKAMAIPLGRIGSGRDIAAAVVYLCSPAASWVTGEIVKVTGGMH